MRKKIKKRKGVYISLRKKLKTPNTKSGVGLNLQNKVEEYMFCLSLIKLLA